MALFGPYLAACLLLVAAGGAKALRPDDTARALGALVAVGMARMRPWVRVGACAEALLGLGALLVPSAVLAVAVAASFAGFGAFVAYARRRGGALASCGCFASPDTPATRLHVLVDLGLAGSAAVVAAGLAASGSPAPRSTLGVLAGQPGHGGPLVLAAVVCAWLVFHVLSTLARAQAARHLVEDSGR